MDGALGSEDAPVALQEEPCVHTHQVHPVSQGSIVLRNAQSCSVNPVDEALCMDDGDLLVTSSSVTSQSLDDGDLPVTSSSTSSQSLELFPQNAFPNVEKEEPLKHTSQIVSPGNMVFEDTESCTKKQSDKALGTDKRDWEGPSSYVASQSSKMFSQDHPNGKKEESLKCTNQIVPLGNIVFEGTESCSAKLPDKALAVGDGDLQGNSQSLKVFPQSNFSDKNFEKEEPLGHIKQTVETENIVFENAGSCRVNLSDKASGLVNGDLHGASACLASQDDGNRELDIEKSRKLSSEEVLPLNVCDSKGLKPSKDIDIAPGLQAEKEAGRRQSSRKRKPSKTYRSSEYCLDLTEGKSTDVLAYDKRKVQYVESHQVDHGGNAAIRNCAFSIQSTQKQLCTQLQTKNQVAASSHSTLPQTSGLLNSCNTPPMYSPGQQEVFEKKPEQRYHCDQCQIMFKAKNTLMVHLATKHIFVKQSPLSNTQPPDTNPPTLESDLDLPTTQVHAKDLGVNPSNINNCPESSSLNTTVARVDLEHAQLSHLESKTNAEVVRKVGSGGPTSSADNDMERTEGCHTKQGMSFPQKCETEENKTLTVEEQPCRATGAGDKGEDINEVEFMKLMMWLAESNSTNVFWCDICKTRSSIRDIVTHIASHTVLREPKCDVCGKVFMYFSSLRHHAALHTGEKKYKCDTCGKSFLQPASLKAHMVSHSDEKPHKCEVCGNGFKTKKTLIIHMRVHTGEEPFKCPHCSRGFKQYCSFKNHLRVHSGERPFICGECGHSFAEKKTLQNHKLLHSNEKTHQCKLCPKVFKQRAGLACHMKTHTDEKPFHCAECGQFFKFASTLKNHQRLHSSEKPFACMHCPLAFKQRAGLTNHMKVHEK